MSLISSSLRTIFIIFLIGTFSNAAKADWILLFSTGMPNIDEYYKNIILNPACKASPLFMDGASPINSNIFNKIISNFFEVKATNSINKKLLNASHSFDDDALLDSRINLAVVRGKESVIRNAMAWWLVGIRFSSCKNLYEKEIIFLAKSGYPCKNQLRISFQPFKFLSYGTVAYDQAMHLVFEAPLIEDKTPTITDICTAGGYFDWASFSRLVAKQITLKEVSIMMSSHSGQQWSFAQALIDKKGNVAPVTRFENFSKPLFLQGRCPINNDSTLIEKAAFGCPSVGINNSERINYLKKLLLPFSDMRPNKGCVTCHYAQNLTFINRASEALDYRSLTKFTLNHRNINDFRHLGYDLYNRRSISNKMLGFQQH